jgi:hypothetical protein
VNEKDIDRLLYQRFSSGESNRPHNTVLFFHLHLQKHARQSEINMKNMHSSSTPQKQRKRRRGADSPEEGSNGSLSISVDEVNFENARRTRRRGVNNADDRLIMKPESSNGKNVDRSYSDNVGGHSDNDVDPEQRSPQPQSDRRSMTYGAGSTVKQVSLNLIQNGMRSKSIAKETQTSVRKSSPLVRDAVSREICDRASSSNEEDDYRCYISATDSGHNNKKGWLKIIAVVYIVANAIALIALSSVLYTLDFNHKLNVLEKSSMHYKDINNAIEKYTYLLEESERSARNLQTKLNQSQQLNAQLKGAMAQLESEHTSQIEEYKSIFNQHDDDLNEALSRIKVLRGNKDDKMSALDMAWLRMDELLEENNELSHHLNEANKQQLFVARDRELINTVESLTQQLKSVSEEKDELNASNDDLNTLLVLLNQEYELLEYNHHDMVRLLFPVLPYVQSLQYTSEKQHSIILELTSIVHSLHSSLELSQSDAQIQSTESQYAVDAIATAAGELVLQQTAKYDMERALYMEKMEQKLTRMEDEALGAVQVSKLT